MKTTSFSAFLLPFIVDDWRLVEAVLTQEVDGFLAAHGGQHRDGGL